MFDYIPGVYVVRGFRWFCQFRWRRNIWLGHRLRGRFLHQ
jgi:hypothetical protein